MITKVPIDEVLSYSQHVQEIMAELKTECFLDAQINTWHTQIQHDETAFSYYTLDKPSVDQIRILEQASAYSIFIELAMAGEYPVSIKLFGRSH